MFFRAQIVSVIFLYVTLPGIVIGQSPDRAPVKTTLCELTKTPERFNGKLVQFRAEYVSKFELSGFVDDSCAAKIPVGTHHVLDGFPVDGQLAYITTKDEFEHPERLKLRPMIRPPTVTLSQDSSYRMFREYADTKFRWKDGGICLDCPLYRTTVSATGRFDYFPSQAFFVRPTPGGKPYILMGESKDATFARVVLKSVSDVAADPISPSEYEYGKRRNLSLQEAEDLVYAYLDHAVNCRKLGCVLDPIQENPSFPDFYSLQGPGHLGSYDVDPQTGDVWSGVVCKQYVTRPLVKLQRVIRRRIGLTEEEYRKLQRLGPLCDPGETPEVYRK